MSVQVYHYEEDAPKPRTLMLIILLSLLAHILFLLFIFIVNQHIPAFKPVTPQKAPLVSITLVQPPPPAQKKIFMATDPQANAKPPKNPLIESDNNTQLQSQSKVSRNEDSLMPDVTSPRKHASDLHESPNSPSKQQPQQASPPSPKQAQQKPQEQPPQPAKPSEAKQPQQNPSTAKTPTPATPPPKPPPQFDENGLPVLPALNAPTMAQQNPALAANPSPARQAVPPPTQLAEAASLQGRAGMSGAPSPESLQTDLGRYKAKVYRAVGSHWYEKVNRQLQLLSVGTVRVQYTIYKDGTVTTRVIDGGGAEMQILLSLSVNSITEAAPFDPFPPAMLKQVGDSYTDEFSFSVYGN